MKNSLFIAAAFIAALPIAGGATWTPVNDGLPAQTLGISAVVPDPNDPSTAYALTTHGSIYKTTDAAATWRAIGAVAANSLAIDPANQQWLADGSQCPGD